MILEIIESQKRQIELLEAKIKLLEEIVRLEKESRDLWKAEAIDYAKKANDTLNLLDKSIDLFKQKR